MNMLDTIKRLEQLADWHKSRARSPYDRNDREVHQWAERDIRALLAYYARKEDAWCPGGHSMGKEKV